MTVTPQPLTSVLAECGFRIEEIAQPDGTFDFQYIPLTEEEFLHPKEGYHLPNSIFHDTATADVKDILSRRYANDPTIGVFGDLLIKWDIPDLGDHCPDTFVVFGIEPKEANCTEFLVSAEGVRPAFVLEVVSPRYRTADRVKKVRHYARAGVREYIILDRRKQRGDYIDEVIGYRLDDEGQYLPLIPDEEGRVLCQTLGLWIGLHEGKVVMVDAATEERLPTSLELQQQLTQTEQQLTQTEQQLTQTEQQLTQTEQRAIEAEQRATRLAELLRSQGIEPDEI
jgi:Putative restriction endonuclease